MKTNTEAVTGEGTAPRVALSKVNKLEKRMGNRIWNGVLFDRDGIVNPTLAILDNKEGREILELLKLEEIENCSHAPCVCGQVRQFTLKGERPLQQQQAEAHDRYIDDINKGL